MAVLIHSSRSMIVGPKILVTGHNEEFLLGLEVTECSSLMWEQVGGSGPWVK